jgi:D-sedoheptulose 7-phosphate isomerase
LSSAADFEGFARAYSARLSNAVDALPMDAVHSLAEALLGVWREGRQLFIFGNGGSAGNAIHLANDFLYGVSRQFGHALRVTALPANPAVLTCLANDEGYDGIFLRQLAVLARPGDVALALSGSGNSPNIVKALEWCRASGVQSYAVLGYSGGKAKALADVPIHVQVDDMQISEDLQLVVGHMLMQWLHQHRGTVPMTAPSQP